MTTRQLMTDIITNQCNHFTDASSGQIKVKFKEFWAPSNHGQMNVHFGTSKTAVKHRLLKDAYFVEIWMNDIKVYANMWILDEDGDEHELSEYGLQQTIEALLLNGLNNLAVNHPVIFKSNY